MPKVNSVNKDSKQVSLGVKRVEFKSKPVTLTPAQILDQLSIDNCNNQSVEIFDEEPETEQFKKIIKILKKKNSKLQEINLHEVDGKLEIIPKFWKTLTNNKIIKNLTYFGDNNDTNFEDIIEFLMKNETIKNFQLERHFKNGELERLLSLSELNKLEYLQLIMNVQDYEMNLFEKFLEKTTIKEVTLNIKISEKTKKLEEIAKNRNIILRLEESFPHNPIFQL